MYRRSYFRGGRVNYGLGGAVMNVVGNALQGKKLGSGLFEGTVKSLTPWGTAAAAGNFAQGLGQKFDKPGLEKVGELVEQGANTIGGMNAKLAGKLTGIPGLSNAVSNLYGTNQNQSAGVGPGAEGTNQVAGGTYNPLIGVAGQLAQNFLGQAHGGKVRLIKAEDGVNTGTAGETGDPIKGGGPFSAAQAQIEQNLSPLRGNLLSQIESDPNKMAWAQENIPGGLENATIYQLSQASDPQHSETQTDRISRLARNANLPVATETANLYSRMNSGKFDVDVMDQAMLDRGYEGEAGDIFSRGVVEGKIPLGAMISAETKDLGTMDEAGRFNFKVFDVPSGAEFLDANKRSIKGDGRIKGDHNDDLTWHAQLGRGDTRVASREVNPPDPVTPEIIETTVPGDPVAALPRLAPRPIPVNRPQPKLQGKVRLIKDPVKDPEPTPDPGLGRFDVQVEPMWSDYLGSTEINRATGPHGTTREDFEARIRAQQLAEMRRRMDGGR